MSDISRRTFVQTGLNVGAGLLASAALGSLLGCGAPPIPSESRKVSRLLADMHIHPGLNDWNVQTPPGVQYPLLTKAVNTMVNRTEAEWADMHAAGIDLICANHFNVFDEWLSMPTDPNPNAPRHAEHMLDDLERELNTTAAPYAKLARTPDELRAMLDRDTIPKDSDRFRVAVVHAFEGGHALGGDLGPLDIFARRGVAYMTITHFFFKGIASAVNSFPFFPDADSRHAEQGLTDFGKSVLKRMEELGIIVDVTHCTSTALAEVLENTGRPILSSHASARTLGDHPYSHHDEHLTAIADRGGLIAVILYPYILSNYSNLHLAEEHGGMDETVRTIRYLYKILGGHKRIAIGSDFMGYISGPKDLGRISRIYKLRELLLREFDGDETIVSDIMANNAIDFTLANWKGGVSG